MLAAEFGLSTFGIAPDGIGIMTAKGVAIGHNASATTLAGIAVQSQYPWAMFGGGGTGFAQAKQKELDGRNPFSPSVALDIMDKKINKAVESCGPNCTGVDKLVVAAIAQNSYNLDTSKLPKTTNSTTASIDWNAVFTSDIGSTTEDPFAKFRQNATGMNYSTQFMLKLYVHDLRELIGLGYDLPDWATEDNLKFIEDNYLKRIKK